MYVSQVWTLSNSNENPLGTSESKVLTKTSGPIKESNAVRIRTKQDLMDLYRNNKLFPEIRKGKIRWLGNVGRLPRKRDCEESV